MDEINQNISSIVHRINSYNFMPVSSEKEGFTIDPSTGNDGVPDLENTDWLVRTFAVRDLVRLGNENMDAIRQNLTSANPNIRQLFTKALGILGADSGAEDVSGRLKNDDDSIVRSYAAITLGQLGQADYLPLLEDKSENDPNQDVKHQCKLSAYQLRNGIKPSPDLSQIYSSLDESEFKKVSVGDQAVDFSLRNTRGNLLKLSDFIGRKNIVLIWVFADWCPVCHNEFHELIELEEEYRKNDIEVFTLECHDYYRSRVMVGEEDIIPKYWFAEESPQEHYSKIWWNHLVDIACKVGNIYGVDSMAYAVHSEYINRPSTVIIDKDGIVRFAAYGTYWGDRPSIHEVLETVQNF